MVDFITVYDCCITVYDCFITVFNHQQLMNGDV